MFTYNLKKKKIWVAGHKGMVGRALVKKLLKNDCNVITVDKEELNLSNQIDTRNWIKKNKPDVIYLAAAKVGGIKANMNHKSSFLYENLMIQNNVIKAANDFDTEKLVFLGSSCIYPKVTKQPMKEEELLNGKLEETNEGYAIAKISVAKYCQFLSDKGFNYKTIIPCNIYGKYDDFSLAGSHMIPGVIARIHKAKIKKENFVEIWGDGTARREFMYSEDLADAIWFCVKNIKQIPKFINVGIGEDFSIKDYYQAISQIVGFKGEFKFDRTKPVGMKRKLVSSKKINQLGWMPKFSLNKGISFTYNYYVKEIQN